MYCSFESRSWASVRLRTEPRTPRLWTPLQITRVRLEFSGFGARASSPTSSRSAVFESSCHWGVNVRSFSSRPAIKISPVSMAGSAICFTGSEVISDRRCVTRFQTIPPSRTTCPVRSSGTTVWRCLEEDFHAGIFRPDMTMQFYERVEICERLQYGVVRISRVGERSRYMLGKLRAYDGQRAHVPEMPRPPGVALGAGDGCSAWFRSASNSSSSAWQAAFSPSLRLSARQDCGSSPSIDRRVAKKRA